MIVKTTQDLAGGSRRYHLFRTWRDRIFFAGFLLAILIGIAGLAALLIDVLIDGLGLLNWKFMTTYASRKPLESGILAPMAGTVWVVGLTAIFTIHSQFILNRIW